MNPRISIFFKALSDPSRLNIFHSLMIISSTLTINQISSDFNMSRQGVTKHIKILENAGLINIKTMGRERFCKANPIALQEFKKWLNFYEQFWDDSISKLSDYLEEKTNED